MQPVVFLQNPISAEKQINDTNIETQSLLYSIDMLKYQFQEEIRRLKEEILQKQAQVEALKNKRAKISKLKKQSWLKEDQITCPIEDGIISEIRILRGYAEFFRSSLCD